MKLIRKGITTYEYVVAMRAMSEAPAGSIDDDNQNVIYSPSGSATTGFSGGSSLGLQYKGAWCTPPRVFVDHQGITIYEYVVAMRAMSEAPAGSIDDDNQNVIYSPSGSATTGFSGGSSLGLQYKGSQVCSLLWSKREKELLSSHGPTQNQLTLWKYPSMVKIVELLGHTSRVLFQTRSPDSCMVASAAGDETLRIWNVFETPEVAKLTTGTTCAGPFSYLNDIR
ncbi:hypothetical protein AAC387_Pa11g0801 [Persea americana]